MMDKTNALHVHPRTISLVYDQPADNAVLDELFQARALTALPPDEPKQRAQVYQKGKVETSDYRTNARFAIDCSAGATSGPTVID